MSLQFIPRRRNMHPDSTALEIFQSLEHMSIGISGQLPLETISLSVSSTSPDPLRRETDPHFMWDLESHRDILTTRLVILW